MYKIKIILLSFLIIVSISCKQLTPEQAFVQDFSNAPKSSVPIDTLINSDSFLLVNNKKYNGVSAYFDDRNIFKSLKVNIDIPNNYKLDRIWFIYSLKVFRTNTPVVNIRDYITNNFDKKNVYSTETDIFPQPRYSNSSEDEKYYEFHNINDFIALIAIRIKMGSKTYYCIGPVASPARVY